MHSASRVDNKQLLIGEDLVSLVVVGMGLTLRQPLQYLGLRQIWNFSAMSGVKAEFLACSLDCADTHVCSSALLEFLCHSCRRDLRVFEKYGFHISHSSLTQLPFASTA